MTAFAMDAGALVAAFEAAGYADVDVSDAITAWRDDGRVWEVVVDQGGRLKATVTWPSAAPEESSLPVGDRAARALIEVTTVVSVAFELRNASELAGVLQAVETLVSERLRRG